MKKKFYGLFLCTLSFCHVFASELDVGIDRKRPREESHYADATVDVAFKEMMWKGDNDPVAKSFIQTFVPDVEIESVEIMNTESLAIPALKHRGKKQTFMDFHVKAKNGHHYIIEMQSKRHIRFDERALFYTCSTYSRQLDEKAFADESWYRHLKPVIAIQVVDYDTNRSQGIKVKEKNEKGEEVTVVDPDDKRFVERVKASPLAKEQAEKHYMMTDQHSGQKLDHLQMIQVELPRYKISSLPQSGETSTDKDWWIRVLRFSENYKNEDIATMPDFAKQALGRLDYTKWAPRLMEEYKESLNDRTAYSTVLQVEREEGKAEGIKEGEVKGKIEMLIDDGLKDDQIFEKLKIKHIDLTQAQIKKVREKFKQQGE